MARPGSLYDFMADSTPIHGFLVDSRPSADPQYSEKNARDNVPALARHPHLFSDINSLTKNAGIGETPLVLISPNGPHLASVTKENGRDMIILGSGFLERSNRQEVRGVIGHELAHVALGHVKTHSKFRNTLVNGLTALIPGVEHLRMFRSRRREKAADKKGAEIAGGTEGLVGFFSKQQELERQNGTPSSGIGVRLERLKDSHPTDSKRIKTLQRFAAKHGGELGRDDLLAKANIASMALTGKSSTHAQAAPIAKGLKVDASSAPQVPGALKSLVKKPTVSLARKAPKNTAPRGPSMRG